MRFVLRPTAPAHPPLHAVRQVRRQWFRANARPRRPAFCRWCAGRCRMLPRWSQRRKTRPRAARSAAPVKAPPCQPLPFVRFCYHTSRTEKMQEAESFCTSRLTNETLVVIINMLLSGRHPQTQKWACSSAGRANGSILCPQIWGCSASVRQMVRIYAAKKVNKGL